MKSIIRRLRGKKDCEKIENNKSQLNAPNITWQHVWSFDETRPALRKSVFTQIPNEIMLRILKFLTVPDLCNISLVCRRFKMIADQDEIWKIKCNTSTKLYSKSFKQMYMDWMYMKCLHNIKLWASYQWMRTGCIICLPPAYPTRPTEKYRFEVISGFHEHPNASPAITIQLSVDVDKTARELIGLLKKTSKFEQQWHQPLFLKQMIKRYYRFMQLKASYPSNILLIPTLDIEIVWQTHLLRPEMYQADCLRLFHRMIDHSLLILDIEKFLKTKAFRDTCHLYEQRFGEQYCPLPLTENERDDTSNFRNHRFNSNSTDLSTYSYWDESHFKFSSELPKDYENPFSFTEGDIIMDSKWLESCEKFMSDAMKQAPLDDYHRMHISGGIDLSSGAMKRLKKSYERFLYMAAKYPLDGDNGFIPPTYAIDIIWHSHMQEPLKYAADCLRLVGYVIHHAPWPMIEDGAMNKARDQTDNIWNGEFKANIMTDHLFNTIENGPDYDD